MSFLNKFRLGNIIEEYVRSHRNDFVFIDQEHINRLQKFYLCMLEDLVPIFEAEGIKICLGGGSLLGKIRHNGFIPWDDDFDISVTREDYEKIMDLFRYNKRNICEKYDFRGPGYYKGAEVRMGKIYKKDSVYESVFSKKNAMNKLFIDIAIIENVPDNKLLCFIKGIQTILLIAIIGFVETKENVINHNLGWRWNITYSFYKLIGTVFSIIPLQDWYKKLYEVSGYAEPSKRCTVPLGILLYFGETVQRDVYLPMKKSDFCGIPVWIPNDAEGYLENRYGDWKTIPPVEKREMHYCKRIDFGKMD